MTDELPRYRLTQCAYLPRHQGEPIPTLLRAGEEVVFVGHPGQHMHPVNEAAYRVVQEARDGTKLKQLEQAYLTELRRQKGK
jgi:hypothetical protein